MALAIDRAREVVALLLVDREPVVTVYDAHALKNFS